MSIFGKKKSEYKKIGISEASAEYPPAQLPPFPEQNAMTQQKQEELAKIRELIKLKEQQINMEDEQERLAQEQPQLPQAEQNWSVRQVTVQSVPVLFNSKTNQQIDLYEAIAYILNRINE